MTNRSPELMRSADRSGAEPANCADAPRRSECPTCPPWVEMCAHIDENRVLVMHHVRGDSTPWYVCVPRDFDAHRNFEGDTVLCEHVLRDDAEESFRAIEAQLLRGAE